MNQHYGGEDVFIASRRADMLLDETRRAGLFSMVRSDNRAEAQTRGQDRSHAMKASNA